VSAGLSHQPQAVTADIGVRTNVGSGVSAQALCSTPVDRLAPALSIGALWSIAL
jgi:hypothetical protein